MNWIYYGCIASTRTMLLHKPWQELNPLQYVSSLLFSSTKNKLKWNTSSKKPRSYLLIKRPLNLQVDTKAALLQNKRKSTQQISLINWLFLFFLPYPKVIPRAAPIVLFTSMSISASASSCDPEAADPAVLLAVS